MNVKMDSGPLSYQIRTCFITKTSTILFSETAHTNTELSVTQVFKNYFDLKLLSYKNQSTDLHCKSIGWFLYGTTEKHFGKD